MNYFEFFEKYGAIGVELGIIPEAKYAQYIRYKVYIDLKAQGMTHLDAIYETAARCGCNITTVYRATYIFFAGTGKAVQDI